MTIISAADTFMLMVNNYTFQHHAALLQSYLLAE